MTGFIRTLAAAAAIGALAAPAAAQYYPQQPTYPQQQYPQGYPQQAYPPQQYPQGYGQQGYEYNQGTTGNPVTDIIDQLLGNQYNVTDRQAVRQCANAARAQAQNQYYGNGYGQRSGYNQAFAAPSMHVTSVTSVERRPHGLRVRGTLGTRYAGQYGGHPGYQGQGYQGQGYGNAYGNAYAAGDIGFRCNVDYHGVVSGVRITGATRRY